MVWIRSRVLRNDGVAKGEGVGDCVCEAAFWLPFAMTRRYIRRRKPQSGGFNTTRYSSVGVRCVRLKG